MLVPTLIMGVVAVILLSMGFSRGGGEHLAGLKGAWEMFLHMIPLLVFALIVANMIQVLIPRDTIARLVGAESGFKGLLIGALAGGLSPGGPFINLPIAAGLMQAGASVGVMVSFLTGWSLLAVSRLPMEVGILGWKFTVIRLACTFFFAPLAGWLAKFLFSWVKL